MRTIYLLFIASLYLACNQGTKQEAASTTNNISEIKNHSAIIEKGEALSGEAQAKLASALMKAVQDSGVNYALQFCSLNALDLTKSTVEGVEISRVSHKPRNPLNAANSEEMDIIGRYEKLVAQNVGPSPEVVEKTDHFLYYSPILIPANLCLNCHGKPGVEIAEENFISIQMLYPEDKAIDFALGDLRGMWKIKFDKALL